MVKKTNAAVREALKVKVCDASVRPFLEMKNGKKVYTKCGTQYLGNGPCPNKDMHVLKLKTGFCSNGWCEGKKATDWKGNPVPTCRFYLTCPCECHDDLDRLFAMTGSERLLVDSSGYVTPPRTYWMPSDDPDPILSTVGPTIPRQTIESPDPDRVPATITRDFGPTPTGRAARGQLEWWVKQHCDVWLVDEPGVPCTPAYLATEIGRAEGITPPSVGAISSVFERWVKLGFAVVEKKPTRFVRYTEDGVRLGLEKMKADAKRKGKLQLADDRRNLRR